MKNSFLKEYTSSAKRGSIFWLAYIYLLTLGAYFLAVHQLNFTITSITSTTSTQNEAGSTSTYKLTFIFVHYVLIYMCLFAGAYIWYRNDLKHKNLSSTKLMHVLTAILPFIMIPYHILKTRNWTQGIKAIALTILIMATLYGIYVFVVWNHIIFPRLQTYADQVIQETNENLSNSLNQTETKGEN